MAPSVPQPLVLASADRCRRWSSLLRPGSPRSRRARDLSPPRSRPVLRAPARRDDGGTRGPPGRLEIQGALLGSRADSLFRLRGRTDRGRGDRDHTRAVGEEEQVLAPRLLLAGPEAGHDPVDAQTGLGDDLQKPALARMRRPTPAEPSNATALLRPPTRKGNRARRGPPSPLSRRAGRSRPQRGPGQARAESP